jgi:hypothetical protein
LVQELGIYAQQNGEYGYDIVGLGYSSSESPMMQGQVVAGIQTKDFFLRSIGLSTVLVDFGAGGTDTFMTSINASNAIPSLSYSYTAGAIYRK